MANDGTNCNDANVQKVMHSVNAWSGQHQLLNELANDMGDITRIELHTYFPIYLRKWQINP